MVPARWMSVTALSSHIARGSRPRPRHGFQRMKAADCILRACDCSFSVAPTSSAGTSREAALARGFAVTLFNRGRTNPDLFPEVEKLRGDRAGKLEALRGRSWDAVVDTSGYLPDHVAASARLLRGRVGHYTFVSTISVYADLTRPGTDETAPVHPPAAADVRKVTGESLWPAQGGLRARR